MSTQAIAVQSTKKPPKVEYKKTIFGYTPKWTIFSRFHPIARFSLIFLFNVPFFVLNPFINLFFLALVIGLYIVTKVPKKYYGKFLPFAFTLSFFLFLTYAFFPSAFLKPPYTHVLFSIGGWSYHYENLIVTVTMWIRWMGAIFGTVFIFAITDEKDINIALGYLRVPFFLRLAIATGLRAFFSFYYDAMQIIEAQKARGLDLESMNIFKRLRYYVAVLVPLIMIEMKRADEMSDAADSRGYVPFGSKRARTEFVGRDSKMRGVDYFLTFFAIGLLIAVIVMNILPATQWIVQWFPATPSQLLSIFGLG